MSTKYELTNLATGKTAEFNALSGTLGPDALDISHMIRDLNLFTYDPGFVATASTAPWEFPAPCSRSCSPSHAPRVGSRIGRKWFPIRR